MSTEDGPDGVPTAAPPGQAATSSSPARSSNLNQASISNTKATTTGLKTNAPAGHSLRRVRTSLDGLRSPANISFQATSGGTHSDSESGPPRLPRRSSNFSEYSLNEARNLLNPQRPQDHDAESGDTTSSLAGLSLAFALLPALAGAIFQNGSAVVTDIMLLGLAGVFLHWSVTQPW